MLRRIRLTGRKVLPQSCVEAKVVKVNDKDVKISLAIANIRPLEKMPEEATVKLRLSENKYIETLVFGTVADLKSRLISVKLQNSSAFFAPSCQMRVVGTKDMRGRILGSTSSWKLLICGTGNINDSENSILHYVEKDLGPLVWDLEISEDNYPILLINNKIPNAHAWVQSDPLFISCVFPTIIRRIFEYIFLHYDDEENLCSWAKDWLGYAYSLGVTTPFDGENDREDQNEWISKLQDYFCKQHLVLDIMIQAIEQESE